MRILLVKTTSLGDVIHNLPVASDIRRRFPDARIDWVVEEAFAGIPRLHPAVTDVITVAVRRWRKHLASRTTWREMARLRRDLRGRVYDYVIDTQGLVKSALIARLPWGIRCGYAAEVAREPFAARFYDNSFVIPPNLHAVERNRWLAAAALDYPPDNPLDYGIAAPPPAAPWLPAAPYAVLLTATSRDDKLWPEAQWRELIAELDERGVSAVLPWGSGREQERAQRIAAGYANAVVAPRLGIADLASLLSGACLAVGVDTGLTHLAAALARPTVAIYCSTDPGLTGVYGTAFHRNLGGRAGPPGLAGVLAACADALAGKKA